MVETFYEILEISSFHVETLANLLETFPDVLKDSLIYSKSFLIYLRLILTCFDIPFEVFETLSIGDPSRCILCFCHCCFLPHLKACRILVPRPGIEPAPSVFRSAES